MKLYESKDNDTIINQYNGIWFRCIKGIPTLGIDRSEFKFPNFTVKMHHEPMIKIGKWSQDAENYFPPSAEEIDEIIHLVKFHGEKTLEILLHLYGVTGGCGFIEWSRIKEQFNV